MSPPWIVRDMAEGDHVGILLLARTLDKWFNAQGLSDIGRDLTLHAGFVATRGDRIIAFATWSPVDGEIAGLSWMGVEEREQRSGIGTALLSAVVRAARDAGFRVLEVGTVADSVDYPPYAETRRFYRARGFVDRRVDPKHYGEGEDRYDRLILHLDLARESPAPQGTSRRP